MSAAAQAQPRASTPRAANASASRPATHDEALWAIVQELVRPTPTNEPAEARFRGEQRRRRQLLEHLHLYQRLYPGGAQRDEAIALELEALFQLGSLAGGDYSELSASAAEYVRSPPTRAALHEAAYWQIVCARVQPAASRPTPGPDSELGSWPADDAWLADYREYIRAYPDSRHVPRMAAVLADAARQRDQRGELAELARQLSERFPDHPVTQSLLGQLRRFQTLGQPFRATFEIDGATVDTADFAGRTVVLVVWSSADDASLRRMSEVEAWRARAPAASIIGVNVDLSRSRMATATRELHIDWPQAHDGLGWGGEFVRRWGIRRTPFVFVVGPDGRLCGATADDDWLAFVRDGATSRP